MKVLFAPDWRDGNPYQSLLAEALGRLGVEVVFPHGYRRGMPLARMRERKTADIIHLHWPEAYYSKKSSELLFLFRRLRFGIDLRLALSGRALVATAHNLLPHGQTASALAFHNQKLFIDRADAVMVHSQASRQVIEKTFTVKESKFWFVQHGDLSVTLGAPIARAEARRQLWIDDRPLCLMFGAVDPYKGIEDVIRFWRAHRPAVRLAIIGRSWNRKYARQLVALADGDEDIRFELDWLSNDQLRQWLSAADCAIFNYQAILTSGGASLARSYGIPILIPSRLDTVDLTEPCDRVFRFAEIGPSLSALLETAAARGSSFESAADWRSQTSWDAIAAVHKQAYEQVLSNRS